MAERRRQEEIVQLVLELSKTLVSHYQARLAELQLTSPQAMLLHHLDDPLPMNEVAGKLHCDPSNVTGIVDRLEGRGLIERQHLTKDRRGKEPPLKGEGGRARGGVETIRSSPPGLPTLPAADQAALQDLLERSMASGK